MKKRTLAGIVLAATIPFSLVTTSAASAAEGSLGSLESFDVLGSLGTASSPTPNPTPTPDPDPGTTPTTPTAPELEICPGTPRTGKITQQALFDATNAYRVEHGLAPFKPNAEVSSVAQAWAHCLASTGDFQHNPNYSDQYPDGWTWAGENIALNGDPNATAADIVEQWHNSPGHRANMQNENFNTLGVGVAYSASGAVYAVQNFACY
ncbi:CAP domain-containing protein [Corynebacterium sp. ED61]|uniref:CAP domain-containing protein n=1 Tax=Corynebacterium sp. ED61 TaxID=2211360 RepID=UPI0018842426|nr:CAP domain-containing protein [Corynebacterium sp. ED61]MBF0582142.1 CAP domain-containing protein [Corynebacterium sp. ED61]